MNAYKDLDSRILHVSMHHDEYEYLKELAIQHFECKDVVLPDKLSTILHEWEEDWKN